MNNTLTNMSLNFVEPIIPITLPFTASQSGFARMTLQANPHSVGIFYISSEKYGDHYASLNYNNSSGGGYSGIHTQWFFVERGDTLKTLEQSGSTCALYFFPLSLS